MVQLIIDIGNTRVKAALFEGEHLIMNWLEHHDGSSASLRELAQKLKSQISFEVHSSIISSTTDTGTKVFVEKFNDVDMHLLSHTSILPISLHYNTPNTLGKDRIAAAVGGRSHFEKKDLLIIDLGSCITIDFICSQGNYQGGYILPGLMMRMKSMSKFTGNLPEIEYESVVNADLEEVGKTTESSMTKGVLQGIVFELEGFISMFKTNHPELVVILTGGDATFFESKLKSEIFVDPLLVFKGLRKILSVNVS